MLSKPSSGPQELRGIAEELNAKASQLAADNDLTASKFDDFQNAISQQRQQVVADIKEVHARVTADIKEVQSASLEAVQAVVGDAAAIRQEVQEARDEAAQRTSISACHMSCKRFALLPCQA